MSIAKNIKNCISPVKTVQSNAPTAYKSRQKQYYADSTEAYKEQYTQYSSDYFEAEAQGVDYDDFYAWKWVKCRISDVLEAKSITQDSEEWKLCEITGKYGAYIGRGAKLKTCGNTYLNVNSTGMSGTSATALLRKCNVLWHFFDYYGNIKTEPFCFVDGTNLSTSRPFAYGGFGAFLSGYQHSIIQKNAETAFIKNNTRVVIGSQVYLVRSVSDFSQEFTDDENSARLMQIDVELTEPNNEDDLIKKVANAGAFSWDIAINGKQKINAGETAQMTAVSKRCGEEVTSTEALPIIYDWISSDENIATVDNNGTVTAISSGNVTITAKLRQNPEISGNLTVDVADIPQAGIVITSELPEHIKQLEQFTISAQYVENGTVQNVTLEWEIQDVAESLYNASHTNNTLTVTNYASYGKYVITVKYSSHSKALEIPILSY